MIALLFWIRVVLSGHHRDYYMAFFREKGVSIRTHIERSNTHLHWKAGIQPFVILNSCPQARAV
jgi:hypothetical protein